MGRPPYTPKSLRNALLVQLRADDAQPSRDGGGAVAQVDLAGHKVKVDPLAVRTGHNALGTEDHAVLAAVQGFQGSAHVGLREDLGRLHTPAGEHLVGVVAVVVMVMVVAAAFVVVMVAVLVMVVVVMAAVLVLVMVVIVVAAARILVMVMVVMVVLLHLVEEGVALLHGLQDLRAGELIPGSGHDDGVWGSSP